MNKDNYINIWFYYTNIPSSSKIYKKTILPLSLTQTQTPSSIPNFNYIYILHLKRRTSPKLSKNLLKIDEVLVEVKDEMKIEEGVEEKVMAMPVLE